MTGDVPPISDVQPQISPNASKLHLFAPTKAFARHPLREHTKSKTNFSNQSQQEANLSI